MDKKIFVYTTDSTIAIIEGVYNGLDRITKVLSKKSYLKSKFFENHSKILQELFSNSASYQTIELRTNLLPQSEIHKLFFEYGIKTSKASIQGAYKVDNETLRTTYLQLIDCNFKDISYQNKILEQRIMTELKQKNFDEISEPSFLCFYHCCVPKDIPIYEPSEREIWEMKQTQKRNSVEPIFGGALTNRGIKNIFL